MTRTEQVAPFRAASGFTLIEIVVVVLIIGLIALFVLPRMTGFSKDNGKTAIRHLTGTIHSLRDESEIRQKIFRLTFYLSEQRYDISYLADNGEFVPYHSASVEKGAWGRGMLLKDVVTPRQGKVAEGSASLFFYPQGRVDKGLIHFEEEGHPMTLEVHSLSGKVKWLEGYVEE
jgi:prepilin-type N-terminal cleavage/methylation domain-containing protein